MTSEKNLSEIYEKTLMPALVGLENERKKIIGFMLLPIAIIVLFFITQATGLLPEWVMIFFIIAIIVVVIFVRMKRAAYKLNYKEKVITNLVHHIDPEWAYSPTGSISSGEFYGSKIFTTQYDRYQGDDLIIGKIDKTDFRMSELDVQYKTTSTDSDGNTTESWHVIFKGLFFHADFNKKISGQTFVLPDLAEKLFGKFGQKFQKSISKGELVKLEDIDFEKEFVVYSNDQVEARYILTPKIMESMTAIKKKYPKNKMSFSFIGDRVYCAIEFRKNLFEPRIFTSGVKFKDIVLMHNLIEIIGEIITELNLNTRIWTKD